MRTVRLYLYRKRTDRAVFENLPLVSSSKLAKWTAILNQFGWDNSKKIVEIGLPVEFSMNGIMGVASDFPEIRLFSALPSPTG